MDVSNQFINYVKFDDQKRILISVQQKYQFYLHNDKNRQLLKNAVTDVLKHDFKKLEIGKNVVRITVMEGTEDKNIELVKTELVKGLNMALNFLGKM